MRVNLNILRTLVRSPLRLEISELEFNPSSLCSVSLRAMLVMDNIFP